MSWSKWNGTNLLINTRTAISKAVEDAAEVVKGVALQQVPHDEGTLSQSIDVTQNPNSELNYVIHAGGGPGTGFPRVPYAFRWHENPANFQKGRKSKYIRDPLFMQGPPALSRNLLRELRKVWN